MILFDHNNFPFRFEWDRFEMTRKITDMILDESGNLWPPFNPSDECKWFQTLPVISDVVDWSGIRNPVHVI